MAASKKRLREWLRSQVSRLADKIIYDGLPLIGSNSHCCANRVADILPSDLCEISSSKSGLVVSLSQELAARQKRDY